jgi:pimeloyl-ACP methyl ester carboxylesterase
MSITFPYRLGVEYSARKMKGSSASARISTFQPALVVLGDRTDPIFRERRELLLAWLPNAEPCELPGATHLLYLENPRGMAEALAAFYARHPL